MSLEMASCADGTRGGAAVEREAVLRMTRENMLTFLEVRFGQVPLDLVEAIGVIDDEQQLKQLVRSAAACVDLDGFRDAVARLG